MYEPDSGEDVNLLVLRASEDGHPNMPRIVSSVRIDKIQKTMNSPMCVNEARSDPFVGAVDYFDVVRLRNMFSNLADGRAFN